MSDWIKLAACIGKDPEMFTPELPNAGGQTHRVRDAYDAKVRMALDVCAGCPELVRAACLDDAYATGDKWTIRGGTTGDERVQLRRVEAIHDLRQARAALAVSR